MNSEATGSDMAIEQFGEVLAAMLLTHETAEIGRREVAFMADMDEFVLLVTRAIGAALHSLPEPLLVEVVKEMQVSALVAAPAIAMKGVLTNNTSTRRRLKLAV